MGYVIMNNFEVAHRNVSQLLLSYSGDVVMSPFGPVARWVAQDTLLYLEAILNYGDWRAAGFNAPVIDVKNFARRYGVVL